MLALMFWTYFWYTCTTKSNCAIVIEKFHTIFCLFLLFLCWKIIVWKAISEEQPNEKYVLLIELYVWRCAYWCLHMYGGTYRHTYVHMLVVGLLSIKFVWFFAICLFACVCASFRFHSLFHTWQLLPFVFSTTSL